LEGTPKDVTSNEVVQRIYLGHQANIKGGVGGSAIGDSGQNSIGGLNVKAS